MSRAARQKGESGIYHVMLRGINKQMIFEDDEDHKRFLQVLKDCKAICGFSLLAYCLMGNHLHLLVKEDKEELGLIFKRIGARYVYWYNAKHNRNGHLFQGRFKSEPVDDDRYFLAVLRYIHQNPVNAGLCRNASEYRWSSYHDYLHGFGITDTEFAFSLFSDDKETSKLLFQKYMKKEEMTSCLDIDNAGGRLADNEARKIIIKLCGVKNPDELQSMPPDRRDKSIKTLKENGLSIRQISRLTGISFGIVRKG